MNLKKDFITYSKKYPNDLNIVNRCIDLLESGTNAFSRSSPGHFTASCALLNPDRTKILLTNHKFLNQWLQLGGHFEDDDTLLDAAIREAIEESGIDDIHPIDNEILDIDIHEIPENKNKKEQSHLHYDIRYLLQAGNENFSITDESNDLKWLTFDEAKNCDNESLVRMIYKIYKY